MRIFKKNFFLLWSSHAGLDCHYLGWFWSMYTCVCSCMPVCRHVCARVSDEGLSIEQHSLGLETGFIHGLLL